MFLFPLCSVYDSREPLSYTPERSFGSKLETERVRLLSVKAHFTCSASKLSIQRYSGCERGPTGPGGSLLLPGVWEGSYSARLSRVGFLVEPQNTDWSDGPWTRAVWGCGGGPLWEHVGLWVPGLEPPPPVLRMHRTPTLCEAGS